LQKHILEQAHRKDTKSTVTLKANPFQVSEDFVQKYNVANFEEKEVLHNKAEQLLCRSKVSNLNDKDIQDGHCLSVTLFNPFKIVNKNLRCLTITLHDPRRIIMHCKLKKFCHSLSLSLGTHLFVKVPRTGDSKVTFSVFKSSCHLLLPV